MEITLLVLVALTLLQTTYLLYRTSRSTGNTNKGDILLDTSVLIDGRILAIARSGLIVSRLIVPRSVVRELQFMADKADHDKRERARFGLEIIEKLQQLPGLEVTVSDDGATSEHGVDEQLIILAQKSGAKLCTIDYNLNKAARVQAVEIVNINELAHALRVVHLPGEKIKVQLLQPGQDKKQAVGYLDDGTMVVVDDSRELIGQEVDVELTRVLQTTAGRMMFARRRNAGVRGDEAKSRKEDSKTEQASSDGKARRLLPRRGGRTRTEKRPVVTKPDTTPVAATAPEPLVVKSTAPPRQRVPRRRKTPEDKLVDLANSK